MLIVFEGGDRCGKSTQIKLLSQFLTHHHIPNVIYRFPDRTLATGQVIDSVLKSTLSLPPQAFHLLFSANRWEKQACLLNDLNKGLVVILDRYWYSGVVYTAAQGISMDWAQSADVGLIQPDIKIFMDLHPLEASKRKDYGQEKFENLEFQEKVYDLFQALIRESKENENESSWWVMDASRDIQTIAAELQQKLLPLVERKGS